MTLIELIEDISAIRQILDQIEVRGAKNASALLNACEKCEHVYSALRETLSEIQNGSKKVGEDNAELDTGSS